jgi:choline-glycine betaine transporter
MTPHTPYSEILQITADAKEANADCLVTLGAGSITDGAKMVAFVRFSITSMQAALLIFGAVPCQRYQDARGAHQIFRGEQGCALGDSRANSTFDNDSHEPLWRRGTSA